jgi:hypothetical protein
MPDGSEILLDGGPSLLDFDSFFSEFVSTKTTLAEHAFKRFAKDVHEDPTHLRIACMKTTEKYEGWLRYDTADIKAGFGRLDAFGEIFNGIALKLHNPPERLRRPNAPASYPCLWDIPKHDRVEWSGSAPNLGVRRTGSILRNVGAVLGVFGDLEIVSSSGVPVIKQR